MALHRFEWFRRIFKSNLGELKHKEALILSAETRNEMRYKKEHSSQPVTDVIQAENGEITESSSHGSSFDIAFIYEREQEALFMHELLKRLAPELTTNYGLGSEQEMLTSVDMSQLVVALLSPRFIESSKCLDEFNIALARHRKETQRPVLYSVHLARLPPYPTYLHLVPCCIALEDKLWRRIQTEGSVKQVGNIPESKMCRVF